MSIIQDVCLFFCYYISSLILSLRPSLFLISSISIFVLDQSNQDVKQRNIPVNVLKLYKVTL